MARRKQHRPPRARSFDLFPKLSIEIRLLIWEFTWPESRMITASLLRNRGAGTNMVGGGDDGAEGAEELSEIINLRLVGTLSSMLEKDLHDWMKGEEDEEDEDCPPPVALHVCQESRIHTLRQYRLTTSLAGPLYYNPRRDVIFFCFEDRGGQIPIHRYDKTELNTLETALVLESEWTDRPRDIVSGVTKRRRRIDYIPDFISNLRGLKTIRILWEGIGGPYGPCVPPWIEPEHPQALANRLRGNFQFIIENEPYTATKLEVVHPDGNLY